MAREGGRKGGDESDDEDSHTVVLEEMADQFVSSDNSSVVQVLHPALQPVPYNEPDGAEGEGLGWYVKLADFGLSRTMALNDAQDPGKIAMTCCGSPAWTAPEVFRGERYTTAIDMYVHIHTQREREGGGVCYARARRST